MDNNQIPQEPQYTPAPQQPGKPFAIAALVLGIVAVALAWLGVTSILSLVLSIVGLVLAIKARNLMPVGVPGRGMATAGLILSIIGIVCGAIGLICWICAACVANAIVQGAQSVATDSDWNEFFDAISSAAAALE